MTGYVADLSWKSGVGDWKVRSTKVDAGDFKHELLNRLRSTMAVNVLIFQLKWDYDKKLKYLRTGCNTVSNKIKKFQYIDFIFETYFRHVSLQFGRSGKVTSGKYV